MKEIQHKVPLAPYTTLKVGGSAEQFIEVHDESQLQEAVLYAKDHALPVTVLGGGSNVLVSDEGVAGLVIHLAIKGRTEEVEDNRVHMHVAAGETLDELVAHCVAQGYWGLENLSHIPGSVGATPVQNVGAYGVEAKDMITNVRVYDMDSDTFKELTTAECAFGYRDSLFKTQEGKRYVITSVQYELSTIPHPQISYRDLRNVFGDTAPSLSEIRDAVIQIRSKKFPDWHTVGTAGSFFKNPIVMREKYAALKEQYPELPGFELADGSVKLPLAWVLDTVLHLKGVHDGEVGTYHGQALVIVNNGNADAKQIENFANSIVAKVHDILGVHIEWEVTKIK